MSQLPGNAVLYDQTPSTPAAYRGVGSEIVRHVGRAWLSVFGWKLRGDWPREIDKCVLVAAPHTSNWDGLHMVATAGALRVKLAWMGKKALADNPLGWLIKRAGLVPIDRSEGNDTVAQTVAAFAAAESLILAIAPEGTRSKTEGWKSGFYRIAHAAGVPIVLSVLDYGDKTVHLAGQLTPSGDYAADLAWMQAQYSAARGLKADQFSAG